MCLMPTSKPGRGVRDSRAMIYSIFALMNQIGK
jgi:hypothetical protein